MKISLCIICKDEEERIARCINSVKDVIDEIVVVDTGSTDQTIEIAQSLGARIFEIKWENNFSKARNHALKKCMGDWIIFLDADEYLSRESKEYLRNQIKEAERKKKDFILCEMFNEGTTNVESSFKVIRIFKHSPLIEYIGRVHEHLQKKKGELQGIDCSSQIKVYHDGYQKEVVTNRNKTERNLAILFEELKENPTSSDLHYYFMQTYRVQGEINKCWEHGLEALKYKNATLNGVYEEIYGMLISICAEKNEDMKKTQKIYNEATELCKDYPDIEYKYGFYLYNQKQYVECSEHMELCLQKLEKYKGAATTAVSTNVNVVWDILAKSYMIQQRYQEVIPILVSILKVNLYDFEALYNLIVILQDKESAEAIGNFLSDLYDLANMKNQFVLLKVSMQAKNADLYAYFERFASEAVKKMLQ